LSSRRAASLQGFGSENQSRLGAEADQREFDFEPTWQELGQQLQLNHRSPGKGQH